MNRKLILCIALCFVPLAVLAQQDSQSVALERGVASAKSKVDSINILINQCRDRYLLEPESRKQITTQLSVLESEAADLKLKYDSALAELIEYEQRSYISGNGGELVAQQFNMEDTSSVAVYRTKRANLVYNDHFEQYVSLADIKTLRQLQYKESVVATNIKEYLRIYDKMVSLQLEYERVDTQEAADVVLHQLDSVRVVAKSWEKGIMDIWHNIYDNKVYIYNLAMEKAGNEDVIASADNLLAGAVSASEQKVADCESAALCEYYYRKQALLGYEGKVASAMGLTIARDSLAKAMGAMKESSYTLPKVHIVRRAFIEHEPLKVIKPTIYTSKNPIPHTKIYEFGTVYRIRIGIFTNRPNLSALKGITPLSYTDKYHNGKYAYYVGGFRSEEEAAEGVIYLKKLGFKSPQIVMWVDGEYISDIEGWKSKNLGFNIEITGVSVLPDAVKAHILLRNEKCRFSRVGSSFIAGSFASKEDAEVVVSEIVAMDNSIKAVVKSVK